MKNIKIILLIVGLICPAAVGGAQEGNVEVSGGSAAAVNGSLPANQEQEPGGSLNIERDPASGQADVRSAGHSGNQLIAAPAEPQLPTETFQLKFVRPESVADKVREAMGTAPGGVIVDEQRRQLEVTAPSSVLEKLKALIAGLDKERDIALEVKAVQIDLNDEHRAGVSWSAIVSNYKNFIASDDNRKFSAGTISQDDLDVLLGALGTVGEIKVFSVRAVTVYNGQDSDLRLKAFDQDVTVTIIPQGSANARPHEMQDRYTARLLLSPTASSDDAVDILITSSDGTNTSIHVKKDSIAVIGGIFTQTKLESTKKFPFLGDLPLFGVVFRDQSKVVHRLENILFLTPRVVTSSSRP